MSDRSPAHDLALFLADEGIGTFGGSVGWCIGVDREPVNPVQAITLYDTGGAPFYHGIGLHTPTIQVRVRAGDYPTAYAKQVQIQTEFDDAIGVETLFSGLSYRYTGIIATTEILTIGRDDNDRILLTANYRVHRQKVEAA